MNLLNLYLQGPFGIPNFGNHIEPMISTMYHNRQPPQQFQQPAVGERQNDGGRIIPIFVETRVRNILFIK